MSNPKPQHQEVTIFTDGSCRGNPGPGGWAALLLYPGREETVCGFVPQTTNNRMELLAAIEALRSLRSPTKVTLFTDSLYVRDGITTWLQKWQKNAWLKADGKPVKNADLWKELEAVARTHLIAWRWVAGHTGHPENERVDALARQQIGLHSIAEVIGTFGASEKTGIP